MIPALHRKFLTAGGNPTMIFEGAIPSQYEALTEEGLKIADQVGFMRSKDNLPTLHMMGGELCINATLAFASILDVRGKLMTSGISTPITYSNETTTSLSLSVSWKHIDNLVILTGIGFIFIESNDTVTKQQLSDYCSQYSVPAFGSIVFKDTTIDPLIYVAGVDSLVHENACGSGSIAACIYAGESAMDVIQQTGQVIRVKILDENTVNISADVKEIS